MEEKNGLCSLQNRWPLIGYFITFLASALLKDFGLSCRISFIDFYPEFAMVWSRFSRVKALSPYRSGSFRRRHCTNVISATANILFTGMLVVSDCSFITIALFYWILEDIGSIMASSTFKVIIVAFKVIRETTGVGTSLYQVVSLAFMSFVVTKCMVEISVCKGNPFEDIARALKSQNIETRKKEYGDFRRCGFKRLPLATQILSILIGSFSCKISLIQRYDISERSWYVSFGTIVSTFQNYVLGTPAYKMRFVKRKFSHEMLHTNRFREKSNMKLDNSKSSDPLASKTTLRKASSNSFLLYFFSVWRIHLCM